MIILSVILRVIYFVEIGNITRNFTENKITKSQLTMKNETINIAIPKSLHRRMRIESAHRELNLQDATKEAVELWLSKSDKSSVRLPKSKITKM